MCDSYKFVFFLNSYGNCNRISRTIKSVWCTKCFARSVRSTDIWFAKCSVTWPIWKWLLCLASIKFWAKPNVSVQSFSHWFHNWFKSNYKSDLNTIAFIGNQPNLPNEAVREKTIIQKAFYTLDAWQLLLIAGVAFVAVSICCCLWLICWWKERKLQRALIRRLAADVSNNSAKVSPASTPRNKKYPDHLPSTGPSAHHSFQGWRGNKRRAGASSPSHEFEYISFTSDASGPPTVGWNSNQNTLQSINSPTSMQSNLDSTREFSRNQESVGKHRKRTQRTSNVRTAGPNRAPDITTNDKFKPVATSTLDWPIRSDPSLKTADERDRLDSVPKERIIPITTEHFAEEAPWSEEEMDMNRSSYERLRVPPAQANVQDKVFFGDIAGDLLKEPRVTFPDGWNKGPIGSSPTVVRHEQVIEEIEEITNSPYTDPALVQDLLQLQMDEQTRSIIHAIRGELKRLTPTPATAAQHKRRV